MAAFDFSEGLGLVLLAALFLYSSWKNKKLNIIIEKPSDSIFASVISFILVIASGYFAFQVFASDSTNIYKIIGESFRIHPLLLRTKLHKFEEQIQEAIGLTAEQTFERIMGKDGMQLSYAVLGSIVFSYPYAESLSQLRIPMISILSRSYAVMLILISCGQAIPNRGLWKKWGILGLLAIGIAQLFCLTNLQFLNLEGNETLMAITNRYKSIGFIMILMGMLFVGERKMPNQNEVLLQTVRNLHVSLDLSSPHLFFSQYLWHFVLQETIAYLRNTNSVLHATIKNERLLSRFQS
jgi:hypothetical protein